MKNSIFLSERNVHLVLQGGNVTGSFEEGYYYNEESMYINEADAILKFCKFVDKVGGCGPINIQELWFAFNNPTTHDGKQIVKKWETKFAEIRKLTSESISQKVVR